MHEWLLSCPSVSRLAYGANLLLPVKTLPEACQKLNSLLSAVEIDPKNTWDFLYRINKRRDSRCSVEGLQINRLATWSIVRITEVRVQISVGARRAPQITQSSDADDSNVCRLELDINTAPEFDRTIDKNIRPKLFEELINLGNEITTKGDIPWVAISRLFRMQQRHTHKTRCLRKELLVNFLPTLSSASNIIWRRFLCQ